MSLLPMKLRKVVSINQLKTVHSNKNDICDAKMLKETVFLNTYDLYIYITWNYF